MNQDERQYSSHKNEEGGFSYTKDQLESLLEQAGEYAETRLKLWQYKAIHKTSDLFATAISGLIVALAFIFFLGLFNIALAFFIGSLLGKTYWGFFILAGIYLLIWFIFRAGNNRWFKVPLTNFIIKKFF